MSNPIKFTPVQDRAIINAACSLARMAKKGQTVAFDMNIYAEITLGINTGRELKNDLVKKLSSPDEDEVELTAEEADQIRKVLDSQKRDSLYQRQKQAFIEALQDAFTLNEVTEICPCLLLEVGYGVSDWLSALPPYANVFLVVPRPAARDVLCLPL